MTGERNNTIIQNFEDLSEGEKGAERLALLRQMMGEERLDAWLVPHGDEHQNEYPPKHAWRLAWLTGFTGSAGYCIVTQEDAVVFVDGRYSAQVKNQIDTDHFTVADLITLPPHKWLKNWLAKSPLQRNQNDSEFKTARIGFDPWLTTIAAKNKFGKASNSGNSMFVACDNLIDRIWHDQPNLPLEPVSIHPQEFCGNLAFDKIKSIKEELVKKAADVCLITDPASIAWLFNIRGQDTRHTPLALGYAVIRVDDFAMLFMDKRKMSREVEAYLTQLADLHPPNRLDEELANLARDKKVLADYSRVSTALGDIVTNNNGVLVEGPDPVALPRAIKNQSEIKGSYQAHLRDGVAVSRFLYWLDQQAPGSIDEIIAVKKLETLRRQTAEKFGSKLMDNSFDTISGAGAHGAVVHYRVTLDSNAMLEDNSLYLVDSGAQYEDGTTDITRTIAIGTPPRLAIEDFTLVLKGHIALALARFPQTTRGVDLDTLARMALWQLGRDYAHGTGHGIGSYLSVHEGPQSISKRGMCELKPGMILSNEPGYYREGKWGIRIENLLLIKPPRQFDEGNIPVLGFETLSLAPIDGRLIDVDMMNETELHWLNAYHGWVKRKLSQYLTPEEAKWLEDATRPLSQELPVASA